MQKFWKLLLHILFALQKYRQFFKLLNIGYFLRFGGLVFCKIYTSIIEKDSEIKIACYNKGSGGDFF